MAATPKQRSLLDVLDMDAYLLDMEQDVQAVITRSANRARTPDEADDIGILIDVRSRIAALRKCVIRQHPDYQERV